MPKPRAPRGFETLPDGRVHPKGKTAEGGIVCPKSRKRMTRDEQRRAGSLYVGKRVPCPECGAEARAEYGAPYPQDWTYGKHFRADRHVVNGHVVDIVTVPELEEGGPDAAALPSW